VELKPAFIKKIGFVKGFEDTVRGRIEAEWSYQNGQFIYKVTIPDGINAAFRGESLAAGAHQFIVEE